MCLMLLLLLFGAAISQSANAEKGQFYMNDEAGNINQDLFKHLRVYFFVGIINPAIHLLLKLLQTPPPLSLLVNLISFAVLLSSFVKFHRLERQHARQAQNPAGLRRRR